MISKLLQIFNVPITDLANDKVPLPSLSLARLTRLHVGVGGGWSRGGGLLDSRIVSTRQRSDGNTRRVPTLVTILRTQALQQTIGFYSSY